MGGVKGGGVKQLDVREIHATRTGSSTLRPLQMELPNEQRYFVHFAGLYPIPFVCTFFQNFISNVYSMKAAARLTIATAER